MTTAWHHPGRSAKLESSTRNYLGSGRRSGVRVEDVAAFRARAEAWLAARRAYIDAEAGFDTPNDHELISVTCTLIAPAMMFASI